MESLVFLGTSRKLNDIVKSTFRHCSPQHPWLARTLSKSDEFLTYATENRKEWATKGEQIVEEMLSKVEPQDFDLENSRHIRNEDEY